MKLDSIAARLILARTRLQLTQEEVAKRAGVTQGTIGNIEADLRRNPRELLAIAAAVGVRPEWLRDGKGPMETAATAVQAVNITEKPDPLAHALSHRTPIVDSRTLVWEDMVIEDVTGQFLMAIVGDALAPDYLPGQAGIWEAGSEGRAGKPVLLVDERGDFFLRLYEPRAGGSWAGISQRVGHRTLTPEADGARIIARLRYLDLG